MTLPYEDVALDSDGKYTYRYHTHESPFAGNVEILRHGEPWLANPPGSQAWIDAANTIQELRTTVEQLQAERNDLIS